MNCPRCNVSLVAHQAARVLLHGCATCGGLWLDGDASRRVVEAIDPAVVDAADAESRNARSLQVDVSRAAPCPVCAQPLRRMPIDQAHVDVDACEIHGVWFDRDELQRVIRAVAPPAQTPALTPALTPAPTPGPAPTPPAGGMPAAAFFSPTNEAPTAFQQQAPAMGTNPAAAFFTDTNDTPSMSGAASPNPQRPGGQWGLGKTALVIGGGAAAVAGAGYLATHTDLGRKAISSMTGGGPSLTDVGSLISKLF